MGEFVKRRKKYASRVVSDLLCLDTCILFLVNNKFFAYFTLSSSLLHTSSKRSRETACSYIDL